MDALELLKSDHDKVRALFDEFRSADESDDMDRMRSLQKSIFQELEAHTSIEEEVFYPAVKDAGVEELTSSVAEAVQEHHVVKVLMREIEDLQDEEIFVAKMTVLIENVEHHADEEETDMFPVVREHMSAERLEDLGAELEAAKASA